MRVLPLLRLLPLPLAALMACHRSPASRAAAHAPADTADDTAGRLAPPLPSQETLDSIRHAAQFARITPESVDGASGLAVQDSTGPDLLRVQILLDEAGFSPGIMDGHWGHNTTSALRSFERAADLPPDGRVGDDVLRALRERTGGRPVLIRYRVSEADVKGPFVEIPPTPYAQARLACMCFENVGELLAERFHSTIPLLRQLNGGRRLGRLRAGDTLVVPDVRRAEPEGELAELVVSKKGGFTQGMDADGNVLFHFPSTLGSKYDPSPDGRFTVTEIAENPEFHYDPTLYHEIREARPDAWMKSGPNSPVGVVWMALSAPHYGIHGTPHPETIGYADSHGCVRLTNWDARWLARRIHTGTVVVFR